jgi:hypothetical protein
MRARRLPRHTSSSKAVSLLALIRGLWIAFDVAYLDRGTIQIDGFLRNTLQKNARTILTLDDPLSHQQGISVSYNDGLATRIGADFCTFFGA